MGINNLPESMLACRHVEFEKPYKIEQVPVPQDLKPNDILIKVAVASFCHTDSMVHEGVMGTELPCIGSHEGTGTIAAVGSSVSKFKEGDRVMVGICRDPCGKCENCNSTDYKQYCQFFSGMIGVTVDGNFAEYVVADSRTSCLLPDKVSFETAAPMACAGCTVWRAVLQAKLKSGQWLAIVGSGGGLGHLGLQFAKALGLKVVAIDARDEGLELSKNTGADLVLDARKGDEYLIKEVHKVTDDKGAEATVNVSDAKSAAATACAVTKMHGKMIQTAQPEQVSIPFKEFVFRDIRVEGSLICTPEEAKKMLDIVAEHNITVKTNVFKGVGEVPKLVELYESGKMQGKGIIIIDEEQIKQEQQLSSKLT